MMIGCVVDWPAAPVPLITFTVTVEVLVRWLLGTAALSVTVVKADVIVVRVLEVDVWVVTLVETVIVDVEPELRTMAVAVEVTVLMGSPVKKAVMIRCVCDASGLSAGSGALKVSCLGSIPATICSGRIS